MPRDHRTPLLDDAAATGAWVKVQGGYYNWTAWGTWDGATAQLQYSPDYGATAIDFDGVLLTANGGWTDIPLELGHIRVVISSAGTTSISSRVTGIS